MNRRTSRCAWRAACISSSGSVARMSSSLTPIATPAHSSRSWTQLEQQCLAARRAESAKPHRGRQHRCRVASDGDQDCLLARNPHPGADGPFDHGEVPRLGTGFDLHGQALDDLAESQVAGQESELPPAEAGRAARRLVELACGKRDVELGGARPCRRPRRPRGPAPPPPHRGSRLSRRACFGPAREDPQPSSPGVLPASPRLRTSARSVRLAESRPRPATPGGRPCVHPWAGATDDG